LLTINKESGQEFLFHSHKIFNPASFSTRDADLRINFDSDILFFNHVVFVSPNGHGWQNQMSGLFGDAEGLAPDNVQYLAGNYEDNFWGKLCLWMAEKLKGEFPLKALKDAISVAD
jgi:hypothetical protein